MKIMGICAGRKGGNTEILMKEALMVCQEKGDEIVFVNLHDYHIEPCIGCNSCSKNLAAGKVGCVLDSKDDVKAILETMLTVDGVIIGAPTYDLMPAGLYTMFANRYLTYEAAFLRLRGLMEVKDRVCGIIAVGGSTRAWQSMAQECIQATTFIWPPGFPCRVWLLWTRRCWSVQDCWVSVSMRVRSLLLLSASGWVTPMRAGALSVIPTP